MSDSTEAGYLAPMTAPADDDDLLDQLQPIIVGIAGFADGSLVRPRWQAKDVPPTPQFEVDWIAFGVSHTRPDTYQFEDEVDDGRGGFLAFEYSEEIELMLSAYGPNSSKYIRNARDGFRLGQNRSALQALGSDTAYIGDPVVLPALLHDRWVRRVDMTITLRRYVSRQYLVRIVQGPATSTLDNEQYITPIVVPGVPS